MTIRKRGFLPITGFVAGLGLAFSASAQTAVNLFGTTTPTTPVEDDTNSVTLGLKFYAIQPGTISAIRFYRGQAATANYVARLYSASGTRLGSATVAPSAGTGWLSAPDRAIFGIAETWYQLHSGLRPPDDGAEIDAVRRLGEAYSTFSAACGRYIAGDAKLVDHLHQVGFRDAIGLGNCGNGCVLRQVS